MDSLPNEVLLDVFSYLEYFDLKRCMRVSKTFKAITQHASLDDTLFRSRYVPPEYKHSDAIEHFLHPVFKSITWQQTESPETAFIFFDRDYKIGEEIGTPLFTAAVADEQAFNPPLDSISYDTDICYIENPEGITVRQLFGDSLHYYQSSHDHPSCLPWWHCFGHGDHSSLMSKWTTRPEGPDIQDWYGSQFSEAQSFWIYPSIRRRPK